jgi:hypothetical protein
MLTFEYWPRGSGRAFVSRPDSSIQAARVVLDPLAK